MSIVGNINYDEILTNKPFEVDSTIQNGDSINVVDDNGVEISNCYGITSEIVMVGTENIIPKDDCDTSLEIKITKGLIKTVNCEYNKFTKLSNGLLLFEFDDDKTSLNIHPECCTELGFNPEIGTQMYYVCRWQDEVDVNDCSNYTPTNNVDINGYQIFEFITGGTVTTLPSAQCCYENNLIEVNTPQGIKCKDDSENPCGNLTIVEPLPMVGKVEFFDPNTNENTTIVTTKECCTSLGFNWVMTEDSSNNVGYNCTISMSEIPTISFVNEACCNK